MTTFRELQKEINERKPGWVRRSSRRIDRILEGPATDAPLVLWSAFFAVLICLAGWLDR